MKDREVLAESGVAPTQILGGRTRSSSGYGGAGFAPTSTSTADALDTPTHINATVATSGNVTLSGVQNLDGVTGAEGMVTLVRAQSLPVENGLYRMVSGGWQRISGITIDRATVVRVARGSSLGGTRHVITNETDPVAGVDAMPFEHVLVGNATSNRMMRGTGPGRIIASSLVIDDGTRIQINSGDTTGILNVSRGSSGATIYARNTLTGSAVLGLSEGSSGIAIEGLATGAAGNGVYGHASGGYGVWGSATTGIGGFFENTSTGLALGVTANNSAATLPLAEIDQHSAANSARSALRVVQAGSGRGVEIDSIGIGLDVVASGTVQAVKIARSISTATQPVVEILQGHSGNSQAALKVTQSSTATGDIFSAIEAYATGTNIVGIRSQSTNGRAFFAGYSGGFFYGYRNADGAHAGIELFHDGAADTKDAILLRHDGSGALLKGNMVGTGDLLNLQDNGINALRIPDGGASIFGIGESRPFVVYAANGTLTAADWHARADSSAGARTLTLPAAPEHGRIYLISRTGGNNATINRGGTDTINGNTSQAIANGSLWFFQYHSSTTNWFAIQIA